MAQKIIDIGKAIGSGDGEPLRSAFSKANDNFTELYNKLKFVTIDLSGTSVSVNFQEQNISKILNTIVKTNNGNQVEVVMIHNDDSIILESNVDLTDHEIEIIYI